MVNHSNTDGEVEEGVGVWKVQVVSYYGGVTLMLGSDIHQIFRPWGHQSKVFTQMIPASAGFIAPMASGLPIRCDDGYSWIDSEIFAVTTAYVKTNRTIR